MDPDTLATLATSDLLDRAAMLATDDIAGDSDEFWAAVVALRQRSEQAVFDRAVEWCGGPSARHRALGAKVLAQLGAPDWPFAADSTPIVERLLRDGDDDVVVEALFALGHLHAGSTSGIAAFAQHSSSHVRHAATFALGGRDEPAALDALRFLTTDADFDVRNWATFALGSLCESDTPEIRDALVAKLDDEDHEIRGEAIVGLARRRDSRAVAAIAAELSLDEVSSLAIEAAEIMPSADFVPALRALADRTPGDHTLYRALERCEIILGSDDQLTT